MKSFNNSLIGWASKAAKNHSFSREFGIGVFVVHVLRYLTALFSIWAGYFYFSSVFVRINPEHKAIPIIFAVITLGIVEFFSAWLVTKLTKQVLSGKIVRALILLVFAAFTFGVSFVSSTNGLAMRQSGKANNSKEIISINELKENSINTYYDGIIIDNQAIIQEIKKSPAGWSGGRRAYTTAKQQTNILALNEQIKGFNAERQSKLKAVKTELKEQLTGNRDEMTKEANDYYKYMAIILLLSLVSNVSLQAFSTVIFGEENPKESIKSDLYLFKQSMKTELKQSIAEYMFNLQEIFTKELIFEDVETIENEEIKQSIEGDKQKKIGFMFSQIKDKKEQLKAEKNDYEPGININKTKKDSFRYGTGVCPLCQKEFAKNSHNHKFCSELHRIEYNEKKTGKDLSRFKKIHKTTGV